MVDINSSTGMFRNLFSIGVLAVIIIFATPMTVERTTDLAVANPVIAAGVALFAIIIVLFGRTSRKVDEQLR